MCTSCGHDLAPNDLIPIMSWLRLKGKCRYCGEPISVRYTIVESIGGISAVVWTLALGINLRAALAFIASGVVTVVAYIIYDKIKEKGQTE
ncbi:Peptidase A24 N-terminal domain-containing protein [Lachnospiraceae bacterium NE2001]|nr:Peptidase A24 N-terminal domain-containing protein [Lachnospiraceae bacterium NE2001]